MINYILQSEEEFRMTNIPIKLNNDDFKIKNNSPNKIPEDKKNRNRWTKEEDQLLFYACSQNNILNWQKISKYFKDRSSIQCRERWKTKIDPELNLNDSTKEEDQKIIYYQNLLGNKWSLISKRIEGRSPNFIKNRFILLRKRNFLLDNKLYKKTQKFKNNNHFNGKFDDQISTDLFESENSDFFNFD